MAIHPERDYGKNETIYIRLQADALFSNKVNQALQSRPFCYKLFFCIPSYYEKARLLEAAKALIEEDQALFPRTFRVESSANSLIACRYICPVQEDLDLSLKRLINNVNTCVREVPSCEKAPWFKNHERQIKALIKAHNTGQPVSVYSTLIQVRSN